MPLRTAAGNDHVGCNSTLTREVYHCNILGFTILEHYFYHLAQTRRHFSVAKSRNRFPPLSQPNQTATNNYDSINTPTSPGNADWFQTQSATMSARTPKQAARYTPTGPLHELIDAIEQKTC